MNRTGSDRSAPPTSPPAPGALLLAPGAGSDRNHAALVAVEEAVAPLPVVRFDFPYRKEGRRAPDRAPKLRDAVRQEAQATVEATGIAADRLVLGGRSMGGRMCSMAVADGLAAAGLVLISYPLHPPGKPDRLRVEHFPNVTCPVLFVSATNDPFGAPDEFDQHVGAIAGPVTQVWFPGGGHEIKKRDAEVAAVVADWLAGRPVSSPT